MAPRSVFIAIGVDIFGEGLRRLHGCCNDATALYESFDQRDGWNAHHFIAGQAEKDLICRWLASYLPKNSGVSDLNIVIFVATHGCIDPETGTTFLAMDGCGKQDFGAMLSTKDLRKAVTKCCKQWVAVYPKTRCRVLLILDACRTEMTRGDGTDLHGPSLDEEHEIVRKIVRELSPEPAAKSMFDYCSWRSCSDGEVAHEIRVRPNHYRGVFGLKLEEVLQKGAASNFREVHDEVSQLVEEELERDQRPTTHGHSLMLGLIKLRSQVSEDPRDEKHPKEADVEKPNVPKRPTGAPNGKGGHHKTEKATHEVKQEESKRPYNRPQIPQTHQPEVAQELRARIPQDLLDHFIDRILFKFQEPDKTQSAAGAQKENADHGHDENRDSPKHAEYQFVRTRLPDFSYSLHDVSRMIQVAEEQCLEDMNRSFGLYISGLINRVIRTDDTVTLHFKHERSNDRALGIGDSLGTFFPHGTLIIDGNLMGYEIGHGQKGGKILIKGNIEDASDVGAYMAGGDLIIEGDCKSRNSCDVGYHQYGGDIHIMGRCEGGWIRVGREKQDGKILIEKDIRRKHGSKCLLGMGMTGGLIEVGGDAFPPAGSTAGPQLKGGTVIIHGAARNLGEGLGGGTIECWGKVSYSVGGDMRSGTVVLHGGLDESCSSIGWSAKGGTIVFMTDVDWPSRNVSFCKELEKVRIEVRGDVRAKSGIGERMRSGEIYVEGNCDQGSVGFYQRGGHIEIVGDVGIAGVAMSGGEIVVKGDVRSAGAFMTGGSIRILERVHEVGEGMIDGVIYADGEMPPYEQLRRQGGEIYHKGRQVPFNIKSKLARALYKKTGTRSFGG